MYPLSDHFDGTHFFNPGVDNRKGLLMVLKWKLQGGKVTWPKHLSDRVPTRAGLALPPDSLRVTYVNHATLLVEMPGFTFLTDPIFSKRASPMSWAGLRGCAIRESILMRSQKSMPCW